MSKELLTQADYKALWEQMCERCNELDKRLAQLEPWEKFCDSNCVWTDHHPDCKLAQRTWVGLTEKDWNRDKHSHDFQKGVDWAESILREKNEGR